MAQAKRKDNQSLGFFNRIRERRGTNISEDVLRKPTLAVNFVLFGSEFLPDPKPLVVRQLLPAKPRSSEILWNFSRYKDNRRVTLRQNPHFYLRLPTSVDAYGIGFSERFALKDFPLKENETVYVLVDKPGLCRVYLEAEKRTRTFGNVWMPKGVMIFKDINGKLESEQVVGKDIHDPQELFRRYEHTSPVVPASPSLTSPTHWIPVQDSHLRDWKPLIRETLNSPNISVRIRVGQMVHPVAPESKG
ncbi:hypothetical protein B0F90DRAFT_570947 [Multifurca ochricompacta]|uniref:Uncharacterized protein n=1 Tax=Multifurca ochricompacta TaxID=376703 RepID=A0AAD4QLT2_9AGAM|nr:hypothetical protein B0F90DRAFT_570947 [Multifurca ochricompacta]